MLMLKVLTLMNKYGIIIMKEITTIYYIIVNENEDIPNHFDTLDDAIDYIDKNKSLSKTYKGIERVTETRKMIFHNRRFK